MLLVGDHFLLHTAVEGTKVEAHTWQAAKLRSVGDALGCLKSVGGALGRLRSATAAPCIRRKHLPEASIHGPRVGAREGCGLQRASCLSKSQMQPSNNNNDKNNNNHNNNNNKLSVSLGLSGLCGRLSSVADSSMFSS